MTKLCFMGVGRVIFPDLRVPIRLRDASLIRPPSWKQCPSEGIFSGRYTCAPENRDVNFRRRLAETCPEIKQKVRRMPPPQGSSEKMCVALHGTESDRNANSPAAVKCNMVLMPALSSTLKQPGPKPESTAKPPEADCTPSLLTKPSSRC